MSQRAPVGVRQPGPPGQKRICLRLRMILEIAPWIPDDWTIERGQVTSRPIVSRHRAQSFTKVSPKRAEGETSPPNETTSWSLNLPLSSKKVEIVSMSTIASKVYAFGKWNDSTAQ